MTGWHDWLETELSPLSHKDTNPLGPGPQPLGPHLTLIPSYSKCSHTEEVARSLVLKHRGAFPFNREKTLICFDL